MAVPNVSEWSDEEVREIGNYLRSRDISPSGLPLFVGSDDWQVDSVTRRVGHTSIVGAEISRIEDGKRLSFEFVANDKCDQGVNSSKLTDQVFWLTITLMEYVGIFGIDNLAEKYIVTLSPQMNIYDVKPPGFESEREIELGRIRRLRNPLYSAEPTPNEQEF